MTDEQLRILGDAMDRLDTELYAAERADNVSAQIATLRERARCWREWGELLEKAGKDNYGAILAALRDETHAQQLEGGVR